MSGIFIAVEVCYHDLTILYIGHFIRCLGDKVPQLLSEAERVSADQINRYRFMKILTKYLDAVSAFNKAFAPMVAVTFFQHLLTCCLAAYISFYLGFIAEDYPMRKYFMFSYLLWAIRGIILINFLSTSGEIFANKIQQLWCLVNDYDSPASVEQVTEKVKHHTIFNSNQLRFRRFYQDAVIQGSGGFPIRNSAVKSFRIQRFITIPNYHLPGESWVHFVARLIPIVLITVISLIDAVDMLRFEGAHIKNMSYVPFFVAKADMLVIKLGVVFISLLSMWINREQLEALKFIDAYDERIKKYQYNFIKEPIEFPTPKRSNIEFFMVFLIDSMLVLNLHLMTSLQAPPIQALFHAFYALLICVHDYVILYIANLIRLFGCHEAQLVQILNSDMSRHNLEIFSIINGFSETISIINRAFGKLAFFTFVHHLIGSCMSTYLLFWLIFVCKPFPVRTLFILSSALYNLRMVSYLIHISIIGESIPQKIENLRCLIRRWMNDEELCTPEENWVLGGCTDEEENFQRAVKFNTHQLLLKYLHQGTQISASEYFTINNSAIYATFGAVVTYLMVLIQFQQLEEVKLAEAINQ
ncbi:hypothetical protein DMENIID0001_114170 [Sergentomyia squamirostris]